MTINLPPDPNDAPRAAPAPNYAPPAGTAAQPSQPVQPAAPAFPDGSRGAAYREPYVVTRRNSYRRGMIIGGVIFGAVVVFGSIGFVAIFLATLGR